MMLEVGEVGEATMARAREPWNIRPARKSPSVASSLKTEVQTKANDLIVNVLKPKYRQTAEHRRAIQLHHRHRVELVSEQLLLHCDLRLSKSERLVAIV